MSRDVALTGSAEAGGFLPQAIHYFPLLSVSKTILWEPEILCTQLAPGPGARSFPHTHEPALSQPVAIRGTSHVQPGKDIRKCCRIPGLIGIPWKKWRGKNRQEGSECAHHGANAMTQEVHTST